MKINKLGIIIEQCCAVYKISREDILVPLTRIEAKKTIQYLGYKFFGVSQSELGRFFKTSQPSINRNINHIETEITVYVDTREKVEECRLMIENRLKKQIWLDEHNVNRDSWLNLLEEYSEMVCSEENPDKDKDFFVWLVENFKSPKRLE